MMAIENNSNFSVDFLPVIGYRIFRDNDKLEIPLENTTIGTSCLDGYR